MKEDFLTVKRAAELCDVSARTMYRLARDMGVLVVKYGVYLVAAENIPLLKKSKRTRGNPGWINNSELAAEAQAAALQSRMERIRAAKKQDLKARPRTVAKKPRQDGRYRGKSAD